MQTLLLGQLLWLRSRMRQRDHWSRAELERQQQARLAELLAFARQRSPFYRELHAGFDAAPLEALPVVSKADLMARFDEFVTDRRIRREDVEAYLRRGEERPYLGQYWVTATSGSSGRPGLFLFDRVEWAHVLASFARGPDYAGLPTGLAHRTRTAIVSSTNPTHMSSRVGVTLRSPFVPTLRLDAIALLSEIVERLNAFQPTLLVAYASMAGVLADEQLAGHLQVKPRVVMVSSEVLTHDARRRVEAAWGQGVLFEQYAATEGAGLAAECQRHRGLHLFEDLSIVEVVDEANQPVPPGSFGAKVLLTVLWSRTQPLIRYELDDSLRLSPELCPDGRATRLIDAVQGRTEDTLHLPGTDGRLVAIHPNVFHDVFDGLPVGGWQVIQEPEQLRILIAEPRDGFDPAGLSEAVRAALARQGVPRTQMVVEPVGAIPRTANGKAPLIRALRR
jgi:putative adenylate-forming enzyme